jgi:hypothetical protein
VELPGGQVARFKPVGVARRFPTVAAGTEFVVADVGRLFSTLNLDTPGSATPSEMWLKLRGDAPPNAVARALRGSPFRVDSLIARRALESSLARDPLARVTISTLRVTAVVALLLGIAALLLSVLATLRDEDGELAELEALGIDPLALRRQIRAGALSTALVAAVAAGLASVLLIHVFVSSIDLSADGRDPLPSVAPGVPVLEAAALLGSAAILAAAGIVAVTARAMRGERVGRLRG